MKTPLRFFASLSLALAALSVPASAAINNLADFQTCIGSGGVGDCQLAAGNYSVYSTLTIGRSNFTIKGTVISSRADTTLQRANSSLTWILNVGLSVSNVNIQDLTFDGNRFNLTSINCLGSNGNNTFGIPPYWDVSLTQLSSGTVTADFINAPGTAIVLDGSIQITYSNISNARASGAWLAGNGSGLWYSHVNSSGNAAVGTFGSNEWVYGNTFWRNRYEMSDGGAGGQVFVDYTTSYSNIASNVIDGAYWQTTTGTMANGCLTPVNQRPVGTETQGIGHRFYNNSVLHHTSTGMGFTNTSNIIVSGNNPWDANDAPKYIDGNSYRGMDFHGGAPNYNVTLEHVRVINNLNYGVNFDSNVTGTGFSNGDACMSGNSPLNVNPDTNPPPTLTWAYPLTNTCP